MRAAPALRIKNSDELAREYVSTTLINEYDAGHKLIGKAKKKEKPLKKRSNVSRFSVIYDVESCFDGSSNLNRAAQPFAAVYQNHKSAEKNFESKTKCDFCNKNERNENNCYLNPDKLNNRLSPKMKERMMAFIDNSKGIDVKTNRAKKK